MANTLRKTNQNSGVPDWMGRTWQVVQVDDPRTSFGAIVTDVLTFTGLTISLQHLTSQTLLPSAEINGQVTWGTLDSGTIDLNATQVSGWTSSGQRFQIQYLEGAQGATLVCSLEASGQSQRLRAAALGTGLGALAGAAIGALTGSLLQGFLTGSVTAAIGSLATVVFDSPVPAQDGSTPTWVANDGQHPGGREGQGQGGQGQGTDNPRSLKAVSA